MYILKLYLARRHCGGGGGGGVARHVAVARRHSHVKVALLPPPTLDTQLSSNPWQKVHANDFTVALHLCRIYYNA